MDNLFSLSLFASIYCVATHSPIISDGLNLVKIVLKKSHPPRLLRWWSSSYKTLRDLCEWPEFSLISKNESDPHAASSLSIAQVGQLNLNIVRVSIWNVMNTGLNRKIFWDIKWKIIPANQSGWTFPITKLKVTKITWILSYSASSMSRTWGAHLEMMLIRSSEGRDAMCRSKLSRPVSLPEAWSVRQVWEREKGYAKTLRLWHGPCTGEWPSRWSWCPRTLRGAATCRRWQHSSNVFT